MLHDVGHLINVSARAAIDRGEDAKHEIRAQAYLATWFDDEVLQPIRWHVDAKRYLTATDPIYFSTLSHGSVHSLAVQGGPFSKVEVAAFEAREHFQDAVQLRRWDETAKSPITPTPPLEYFRRYIEAALRPDNRPQA